MNFVILGLLHLWPMSRYQLVQAFESGISLFYAASSGSIKRALDGLLAGGQVEVASIEAGGRGTKTYALTAVGRVVFHAWMTGSVDEGDLETATLARVYFLGLLNAKERDAVLAALEARARADLDRLALLRRQVEVAQVPDDLAEVARYQRAIVGYGVGAHEHALGWLRGLRAPGESTGPTP